MLPSSSSYLAASTLYQKAHLSTSNLQRHFSCNVVLRTKIKAERLVTNVLREKLYFKELQVEQADASWICYYKTLISLNFFQFSPSSIKENYVCAYYVVNVEDNWYEFLIS